MKQFLDRLVLGGLGADVQESGNGAHESQTDDPHRRTSSSTARERFRLTDAYMLIARRRSIMGQSQRHGAPA
jgi:hypothetical protein